MKLQRTLHINIALANIVPLVNVLFLVVTFFALSSRFVLQPGLRVDLPVSSFSVAPQRDSQIVSITAAPVPAIYYRDQRVSLTQLGQLLSERASRENALIIRADRATPFDLVTQVMNTALQQGYPVVLAADSEEQ